jgi:glutamate-1-semialdehyde 2,1-aminomutase
MYQESLNQRAQRHIPGGVNSPVRAFSQVGVEPPIFAASAKGAVLTDVEGKSYVDYIGAWGPMILGHADADVVAAVQAAPLRGLGFGMATEAEVELAELLCKACPSLEMVRLVNSGTEATMSAIRLARGYTKRPRLIKFEGCYHGHADHLLVKAGSGLATFSTAGSTPSAAPNSAPSSAPSSLGVSQEVSDSTMVLPFNDLAVVEQTLKKIGDQVAALILEPVVGNMGLVPPQPGYLQGLRRLCDQYGVVYIFDEVMTGFRSRPRSGGIAGSAGTGAWFCCWRGKRCSRPWASCP